MSMIMGTFSSFENVIKNTVPKVVNENVVANKQNNYNPKSVDNYLKKYGGWLWFVGVIVLVLKILKEL